MNDETKKKIEELSAQITPRGAFEAAMWGTRFPEGARFAEIYAEIRELEGDPITLGYPYRKAA
jgi:hypothetical protein